MSETTELLDAMEHGDRYAASRLLPLVYDELRRLAARRLALEAPGPTLQPTALVHEAYIRLVGAEDRPRWSSRGHFFAAAAEAMRRILVDRARRNARPKHGGDHRRVDWDLVQSVADASEEQLIELDEALSALEQEDPTVAKLVKLRFFGGMTMAEVSQVMGISAATAGRYWLYARTWLLAELDDTNSLTEFNQNRSNS
jgi:RNA polymerase sigma factor (TIGR02999 family)